MTDLCRLANFFGTDKGPKAHNYTPIYDALLSPYRAKAPRILEIGVKEGLSLNMWSRYFGNATILGVDINPKCKELVGDFFVEIGDQSDVSFLRAIGRNYGPFDIIVDDGSHVSTDQILSLLALWPFLNKGGYYCVEDTHTSFMHRYTKGAGVNGTFIDFVKAATDSLLPNTKKHMLSSGLLAVHFYPKLVVMEKR